MARTAHIHKLTAVAVKKFVDAGATNSAIHDGGGLYLRKRQASANWYLRLTNPGTGAQQWLRMFPDDPSAGYPHKSLAQARAEASKLWGTRSQGLDPRVARNLEIRQRQSQLESDQRTAEARVTVRALFERWASTELSPHQRADGKRVGRKDGGRYTREQFERRVFPVVGDTAIEALSRADLMKILDAAKSTGRLRTANMLLADLKQMFRFAVTRDILARNPLDTVTKRDVGGSDVERERFLSPDELKVLFSSLPEAKLSPRSALAIPLILATACRVGEIMGASWEHVDIRNRTWHLPLTKNQRDHTIHLSDFAVRSFRALEALRQAPSKSGETAIQWVFPNRKGDGPVDIKTFGKQLADRQRAPERRLKNRASKSSALTLSGGRWTAHDLRRTAATLMATKGVGADVIDECLNHVIASRVRRVYIRDRREGEQVTAFNTLGETLQALYEANRQP